VTTESKTPKRVPAEQFNVRLRPDLRESVEAFANERGVSLRSVTEDALVLHLSRYGANQ
jgi:hypothetical protein